MSKNILFINGCIREDSRTKELSEHLLKQLGGSVQEVCLCDEDIKPLDKSGLEERTSRLLDGDFSPREFRYAKDFAKADIIVISAPFWDLSFPSVLKVYLEQITLSKITFTYSDKGTPQGLCKAKRLYYVTTSGGYIGNNNFGFDYVKALCKNFYGISDVVFYSAQGLDIKGNDPNSIMQEAKKEITQKEEKNMYLS